MSHTTILNKEDVQIQTEETHGENSENISLNYREKMVRLLSESQEEQSGVGGGSGFPQTQQQQ